MSYVWCICTQYVYVALCIIKVNIRRHYQHKSVHARTGPGATWPLPLQDIVIVIISLRGFKLHNNILCKHCLTKQLCNILYNITTYCTPPPSFEVFLRCLEVFGFGFFFQESVGFRVRMGRGLCKKNPFSTRKGGIIAHYCAIPPSQPPFIAYNIAQYIFPTTPFTLNL